MSLTAIHQYFNEVIPYIKSRRSEYEYQQREQRILEEQIIRKTNSFCPFNKINDRVIRAEQIQEIVDPTSPGFQDPAILQTIMCLNNSTLGLPSKISPESSYRNAQIRHYLTQMNQIGVDSVQGAAYTASVRSLNQNSNREPFVVKVPKNPQKDNDLHEYFVGAYGTNSLRKFIPNFAFIFGHFKCSPSYSEKAEYASALPALSSLSQPALTFCQNTFPKYEVNYLLYENISPAVSFKTLLQSGISVPDYFNILIQIILALDLAYSKISFVHNDLHVQNILIRELNQEILIPYQIGSTTYYLRTNKIATIIDYGRAYIQYEGTSFGYNLLSLGLISSESYPINDLFRITLVSLGTAIFNSAPNFELVKISPLLTSYFGIDINPDGTRVSNFKFLDYIEEAKKFGLTYPNNPKNLSLPRDFFEFILKIFPEICQQFLTTEPLPNIPIYGCNYSGTCTDLETAILKYTLPQEELFLDPYVFSSAVNNADSNDLTTLLEQGIQYLPLYSDILTRQFHNLLDDYDLLQTRIQNLKIIKLSREVIDDSDLFELYRQYLALIAQIFDGMGRMEQVHQIMVWLFKLYPEQKSELTQEYRSLLPEFREAIRKLPSFKEKLQKDWITISTTYQLNNPKTPENVQWLANKMMQLAMSIHLIEPIGKF